MSAQAASDTDTLCCIGKYFNAAILVEDHVAVERMHVVAYSECLLARCDYRQVSVSLKHEA